MTNRSDPSGEDSLIGRERFAIARDQGIFAGWVRAVGHASALVATSGSLAPRKFLGTEPARDLVQHCVHHASLFPLDKGVRDIDIFGYYDPAGHVAAVLELIGARTQDRAQNRIDPLQRPALRQRLVDQRIEPGLVAHDARDDVAKEGGFCGKVFLALDLAAEPVAFE